VKENVMQEENPTVLNVTHADFERKVLASPNPVLVDFWAPWCGPCRAVSPILESLAADYGDRLTVAKVDVDENSALAAEYRVRSIPTVMLVADGEIQRVLVGARPASEYREGVEALLQS